MNLRAASQAAVFLSEILRDTTHFWRANRRNPRYVITLTVLLAVGFAPAVTMFAVLDRALFRPVDLPNLDQVVFIRAAATPPDGDQLTWWSQAKTLEVLATYSTGGANLSALGQSERIQVAVVSPSFFRVAEVQSVFGRTFINDAQTARPEREAVLSYAFAAAHYGAASSALGRSIRLSSISFGVIGVMPPGFQFPGRTDVWVPRPLRRASLGTAPEAELDVASFSQVLIGRLRAHANLSEARAELTVLHRRLEITYRHPGVAFGRGATAVPLKEALSSGSRTALLALSGAVLFVLLLTCANAAGLLLANAAARQKEVAVLVWLGATRGRLIRQLLTESLLLTTQGGMLGIVLAVLGIDLFRAYAPPNIPGLSEVGIDLRTLAFTSIVSVLVGVAVGVAPALQTHVSDIAQTLKEQCERSIGPVRLHARRALVVAQVMLALVLTSGAGLMVESLRELIRIEPGFDARNALTAELALPTARYADHAEDETHAASARQATLPSGHPIGRPTVPARFSSTNARVEAFQQGLFDHTGRLPGVTAVGAVSSLPLTDSAGGYLAFDVRGEPQLETAATFSVAGDYFAAMSIPLRSGRFFTHSDGEAASGVVIINEALARRSWPGTNPVGDTLLLEGETAARQVIGVVGDVKYEGVGEAAGLQIYLPWFQPFSPTGARVANLKMALVVRAASSGQTLAPLIRNAVASLDSEVPLFNVQPLEDVISNSVGPLRLRAALLTFFAVVALVLAGAGVYGLVSYSVANRKHEIGVRMSLGARRGDVLLLVIREGALLGLVGVIPGILVSLEVGRLISSLLFGVLPYDPATLAAASMSLLVLSLVASAIPAFRAASVDPAASIRYE